MTSNRFYTYDIDYYTYCPKYYELIQETNDGDPTPSFPCPDDSSVELIPTALYAHKLRTGMWPGQKELDKILLPHNIDNPNLIGLFSYFLNKHMQLYEPVSILVPLIQNTRFANLYINIPVVAKNISSGDVTVLFFKQYSLFDQYIKTDWQIMCGLNLLYEETGIDKAVIFSFNNSDKQFIPYRFSIELNIEDIKLTENQLKGHTRNMIYALRNGPYNPKFNCTNKQCEFYGNKCKIMGG